MREDRAARPQAKAQAPAGEKRCAVILLAGQRPGIDPVAQHFGRQSKSLVPVAGEAMLARVARILLAAPAVSGIILLAQDIDRQLDESELAWLRNDPRVTSRVSRATISGSVLDVLSTGAPHWPVLVTTADNVFISGALVEEMLNAAGDHDVAVGFVERRRLEEAAGPSSRTWLRFRDGEFTGANLFLLRTPAALEALAFWARVEQDRKTPWKIAARFGPVLLVQILLRRLTLMQALTQIGLRLGTKVRPVLLSDGRVGVDVDKVADHALAEKLLATEDAPRG